MVGFLVVAPDTTGDEIFPAVASTPRFGLDVVDRVRSFSAIRATVIVAPQNPASSEWDPARHWNADIPTKNDDTRPIPESRNSEHRMVRFVSEYVRFSRHDEHDGSSIRDDSERLIAGVEDECSHGVPFVPTWSVGVRVWAIVALILKQKRHRLYRRCLPFSQPSCCVTALGLIGCSQSKPRVEALWAPVKPLRIRFVLVTSTDYARVVFRAVLARYRIPRRTM
jgi:hypothetical protein